MVQWWRHHPGWSTLILTILGSAALLAMDPSRKLEVLGIFVCGLVWSALNGLKAVR
jgi:hypothetical protein